MLVGETVNPMKGVQNFRKRPGGSACFEDLAPKWVGVTLMDSGTHGLSI
jgi:hypothetical protein